MAFSIEPREDYRIKTAGWPGETWLLTHDACKVENGCSAQLVEALSEHVLY